MKFIVACVTSAFYLCFCGNLYAQKASSVIKGRVSTENHVAPDAATIVLLNYKDSSVVNSAAIGKDGIFLFDHILPGGYLLLTTRIGYFKSYNGPYQIGAKDTVTANGILLKIEATQLGEVTIISNRPDVEVKPGKIILNVQNSLLAAGNSVFDILRQSPGVRIDNSNNINISGRQNALITIDGKPTNLSGEDLAGVLRSMQSNTVERIELITGGSLKYDASGGGVINIVLKKGKNVGSNITVTGSAGYGKYYKSNAGIIFNERTEKFNVFGNYSFTADKTFHSIMTNRIIDDDNIISDFNTDYHNTEQTVNNSFRLGADYFLTANQTIGFLINGYTRTDNFVKDNRLNISNQSILDSYITANSNLYRRNTRVNYNLNYAGKISENGSLTADVDYTNYNRTSNEYITNNYFDAAGNKYADTLLQNLSPSDIHVWFAKVDYTVLFSKTAKLEAGVKYSNATSNNNLIFGPFINGRYESDPLFSNHFVYSEKISSSYADYEDIFGKYDLTLGFRAEVTTAKGNSLTADRIVNSNYGNLFPQALLTYQRNEKNEFSIGYNRGITRPGYELINPFLYYIDPYDFGAGNPDLRPEYSNAIELSYAYNKSFLATLYSTIITNAYEFPFYEQNDTTKTNITTNRNLGRIYNYGIKLVLPVVFTKWWNADFYLDGAYQRYVSYPVNGNLNKGTQDVIFNINQHFIISNTITAELYGFYESPNFYGINEFKANYYVNAAIGKQLFSNRGSIKLSATDIFNTRRDRSHTEYENLNISTVDKRETQVARLTFTYRFGKTSVKAISPHNTGNSDEQRRIGSGQN